MDSSDFNLNTMVAKRRYTHKPTFSICAIEFASWVTLAQARLLFVKRILRDQCRLALDFPGEARLPILLELKTVTIPAAVKDKTLGRWLLEHLRTSVTRAAVYKMQECFDSYCKGSGLLILLDGLDEVSKSQYPRVSRAIQLLCDDLATEINNNAIILTILTMRTQFHQQIKDEFRDSVGQAVFVRPFTPTDIFDFLSRWPFKGDKHSLIPQIYTDLTDRPTLREMCSNPLILAMYVAEYETNTAPITPESRTEFYNRVTEDLLIKRRLKQTGKTPAPSKLL